MNEVYLKVRSNKTLSMLVIWTRFLIGFAFIPSGVPKLFGHRFTVLPVSNPVGFFFEALYQSGIYWNFLGLAQLAAAFLLMTQRYATIGNLLFLPIIINVFLITYSMHFTGTVFITALMLLASFCLLLWDYSKWQPLLFRDNFESNVTFKQFPTYNNHWILTGLLFFVEAFALSAVNLVQRSPALSITLICMLILTGTISIFLWVRKRNRNADSEPDKLPNDSDPIKTL